jgi:uncharacterized protein (DUF427 family)
MKSLLNNGRLPRIEPSQRRLEVFFNKEKIADTHRGYVILESSRAPVYYFPPEDVQLEFLVPVYRATFCESKGTACYFTVRVKGREAPLAAWCYRNPESAFEPIRDYIAFYPSLMDECRVDGEIVCSQPGCFYGGWITSDL